MCIVKCIMIENEARIRWGHCKMANMRDDSSKLN